MKKVIYGQNRYYDDLINDDFSGTNLPKISLSGEYLYLPKTILGRVFSFFLFYFIAIPIFQLFNLFYLNIKIYGRHHLKKIKSGYVIYGNHSSHFDAFISQAYLVKWKRSYIVSHPDAVSLKILRFFTKPLGALPLPTTYRGMQNYLKTIQQLLARKKVVVVYPEGHIWPFYTGLRPFEATSFRYASQNNVPAVAIVTTYRYPKGLFKQYRKPKINVHINAPIYPESHLSVKENAQKMHEQTIKFMKTHLDSPTNVALYNYLPRNSASSSS